MGTELLLLGSLVFAAIVVSLMTIEELVLRIIERRERGKVEGNPILFAFALGTGSLWACVVVMLIGILVT